MFDKFRGYKSGSSFWMDDNYFTRDEFDPLTGEEIVAEKRVDFIKLAAYRRTMANFVNIVTGDNIIGGIEFAIGAFVACIPDPLSSIDLYLNCIRTFPSKITESLT